MKHGAHTYNIAENNINATITTATWNNCSITHACLQQKKHELYNIAYRKNNYT
jgi:hypothetical protein